MATVPHATKFALHTMLTDEGIQPAQLGPALEERGFDALFLGEHSHIPVQSQALNPRGGDMPRNYFRALDPFVALSATAAVTENLRLGTSTCLPVQRDPIQTAKEVASLDFTSGGRMIFGIGAGWLRQEIRDHGTDPRTRGALLDERIAAMIEIWTRDEAQFHGRYVDFDPMFSWPKPVQKPYPPIYAGGHGEVAAARAARLGGWMPFSVDAPDKIPGQLALAGPEVPVFIIGCPPRPEMVEAYGEAGVAGIAFNVFDLAEASALSTLDELAKLIG